MENYVNTIAVPLRHLSPASCRQQPEYILRWIDKLLACLSHLDYMNSLSVVN